MHVTFSELPAYSNHVLIDGAFDPIHSGHISYIQSVRALNKGPLLCAVASDDHIREKGREPLLPQASRVAVMEALCDAVYAKDRPTEDVIEKMAPRIYCKGMDWEDKLPPEQVSACGRVGTEMAFVDAWLDSSTARLRDWSRRNDAQNLKSFEEIVQSQQPASTPWQPVTDYSFEARKAIEGKHPELIKEVFQPFSVWDVGCGRGHLVKLLRACGVPNVYGMDLRPPDHDWYRRGDIGAGAKEFDWRSFYGTMELVICREVLEHLTVLQLRRAVRNLCELSSKFVYVTTRFAQDPASLLSVDTSDDLDPTHISMLNQDFLRTLFVLEGAKRRADLEARMDWQKKGRCLVYEVQ